MKKTGGSTETWWICRTMVAQEQTKIIINLITLRAWKPAAAGLEKDGVWSI
jgi:hypothetical protein